VAIAAVTLLGWWRSQHPPKPDVAPPSPSAAASASAYQVERVVDGDTLKLVGGDRLRLIGVNTPETVKPDHPVEPWGPEASEFTKRFVADGPVRLEFDGPRRDKYGRLLAYVYVGDRMLNEELLRAGLGRFESQYHYSAAMKKRFRQDEDDAKAAGVGIWSKRY
jgi:micrococcal nuclease